MVGFVGSVNQDVLVVDAERLNDEEREEKGSKAYEGCVSILSVTSRSPTLVALMHRVTKE